MRTAEDLAERAMTALDRCMNYAGPLPDFVRAQVWAAIDRPDAVTWALAREYVVVNDGKRDITLWAAVRETHGRQAALRTPTPLQIVEALERVTLPV